MTLSEIRRLAALADQDQRGIGARFGHGLDDVAVTKPGGDLCHSVSDQNGVSIFQDRATTLRHQLGALRVQFGQFLHQCCAGARADGAREVLGRRAFTAAKDVEKFHRSARAVRNLASVVADAGRVDRAVDQCDDPLRHVWFPINGPEACPSRRACRGPQACRRWFRTLSSCR